MSEDGDKEPLEITNKQFYYVIEKEEGAIKEAQYISMNEKENYFTIKIRKYSKLSRMFK